ncbi:MAG: formyltransferase family protein [Rhodospirillales bacterium]
MSTIDSKRILILSTDTPHHRYFINQLIDNGIPLAGCLFETTSLEPPFPAGSVFASEEAAFEAAHFFTETRNDLERTEVHQFPDITKPDAVAAIQNSKPDLGVVFGTRRLTPDVISLFRDGLINMHRGIASEYRGLDSDLWAIYHRDWANIGGTVHMIDADLDTGPILATESLNISRNLACHQLRYHTTKIVTRLAVQSLKEYLAGAMSGIPQNKLGRYYSFMPIDLKQIVARRFDRYCEQLPVE